MRRRKKAAPDVSELKALYQKLRDTIYGPLRSRQKTHETMYWCEEDLGFDENYRAPTIPPTARMLVEAPVNHIAMDSIVVTRRPLLKGPSSLETKAAQEEADRIERWLQALLDDWAQVQPYYLREIAKNLSFRGESYGKTGLSPAFLEWLQAGGGETYEGNPFVAEVPDAKTIYSGLDMVDGAIPQEVFEERVLTVRSVKEMLETRYKDVSLPDTLASKQGSDLVVLVEWWTEDWRGYFASDMVSSTVDAVSIGEQQFVPTKARYMPYVRGFSGRGKLPDDGNPAKIAVGSLTGLEGLVIAQARLMTMIDTISAKHALPLAVITVPEGVAVEGKLDLGPGKAYVEERGIKFRYEITPPVPPALIQEKAEINQQLEAFMPGIVSGVAEPAGESGISRSQRLNQARLQWESLFISARHMIEKMLGQVLYLMEHVIEVPVTLRGLRLTPEEIKGHYKVEVDIKPGNPDQLRWDMVLGMQLKGFLPQGTIISKYFHESDVTQILVELAAEEVRRSTTMVEFVGRQAMKELGMEAELAALEAEMAPLEEVGKVFAEGGGPGKTPGSLPGVGGSPRVGATALPEQETPMPGGMSTQAAMRRFP